MCGIFGAISTQGFFNRDQYKLFCDLTDIISYRGPDNSGKLSIDTDSNNFSMDQYNVFLGHRRLSILDLSSDGNQPMSDGDIHLVYNGEIFNYQELRNDICRQGESFHSNTDTEVILKLYKLYGETAFDRLNGMWAFILLDQKKNRVIISRDRFSIKPLYFLKTKKAYFFGSEIKQLLPLLDNKKINESVMYCFLNQSLLDISDETFFENIYKVKPKTNLILDMSTNKIYEKTYWDYSESEEIKLDDAFARFHDLFYDSVRIRLRSDVPIGTMLSGGLDSSLLTVAAQTILNKNIESFSVFSDHKKYTEEKFIDIMIMEKKINNIKLKMTSDISEELLKKVLFHQDEPFASLSIIAQYKMYETIKQKTDVKVILSGQGGDETLMGYLKYYFFYIKNLAKENQLLMLKELFASLLYRTILWDLRFEYAKRYIPYFATKRQPFLKDLGKNVPIWNTSNILKRQIADIDQFSVPVLARYEDRNSMAHSLEVRLPFLDHRLVNFLVHLPASFKIRHGWTKYLLRRSASELPRQIRWRRDKKGFEVPDKVWLKKDLKTMLLSSMKSSRLHEMGYIDVNLFLNSYRKFCKGDRSISHSDIFRVFIAELWIKQNSF